MTTGPTWTGEGVTLPGWDHCLTWEAMLEELSASRQVITA